MCVAYGYRVSALKICDLKWVGYKTPDVKSDDAKIANDIFDESDLLFCNTNELYTLPTVSGS